MNHIVVTIVLIVVDSSFFVDVIDIVSSFVTFAIFAVFVVAILIGGGGSVFGIFVATGRGKRLLMGDDAS